MARERLVISRHPGWPLTGPHSCVGPELPVSRRGVLRDHVALTLAGHPQDVKDELANGCGGVDVPLHAARATASLV